MFEEREGKEKDLFKGKILIECNEKEILKQKIKGTAISISGMFMQLFQNTIDNGLFDKQDIEVMLKLANRDISVDSVKCNEFQDKMLSKALRKD